MLINDAFIAAILISISVAGMFAIALRGSALSGSANIKERLTPLSVFDGAGHPSLRKKTNISDVRVFKLLLQKMVFIKKVSHMLETVSWPISVSVFLMGSTLLGFGGYFFLKTSQQMSGGMEYIGAAVIGLIPTLILRLAYKRYLAKFEMFLPESLAIMSNSVKVGHGMETCMDLVAKTAPYPVNREFTTVKAEIQLGMTLQQALGNLYERLRQPELKILTTGIRIHADLGGNLSEILDNLQKTIRERFTLKREIKTLSAQGIISATVLFLMPFLFTFMWIASDKQMFMDYLATDSGQRGLKICLFLEVVAFFWIKKVINIKD